MPPAMVYIPVIHRDISKLQAGCYSIVTGGITRGVTITFFIF